MCILSIFNLCTRKSSSICSKIKIKNKLSDDIICKEFFLILRIISLNNSYKLFFTNIALKMQIIIIEARIKFRLTTFIFCKWQCKKLIKSTDSFMSYSGYDDWGYLCFPSTFFNVDNISMLGQVANMALPEGRRLKEIATVDSHCSESCQRIDWD